MNTSELITVDRDILGGKSSLDAVLTTLGLKVTFSAA